MDNTVCSHSSQVPLYILCRYHCDTETEPSIYCQKCKNIIRSPLPYSLVLLSLYSSMMKADAYGGWIPLYISNTFNMAATVVSCYEKYKRMKQQLDFTAAYC